jgi:hypothetical protein
MANQAPARSVAPLMHPDLERPISDCELKSARILGVEEISVGLVDQSRYMELNIRLGIVIMVQDIAILREKDVKRLGICGWEMCHQGFIWNNAALPPQAIRDLRKCSQL